MVLYIIYSTRGENYEVIWIYIGMKYILGGRKTNIPDAIFVDNSIEITNASIYAVGLASSKEGQ